MSEAPPCPHCGNKLWSTRGWSSEMPDSYWFCVKCGKRFNKETMKELS